MREKLLLWIMRWCERHLSRPSSYWWQGVTLPDADVLDTTKHLIEQWAAHSTVSGEYKRDQCYKALIRLYPDVPRSQLGLAIEVMYQRG